MSVPLWAWFAVLGVILAMLALDLLAHRRAHVIEVREAAAWSAVWVALGVGFGVVVWQVWGAEHGQQYFAGYLIEKSLAVDNVFVWAIVFAAFGVPRELQHRVLFLGVLGALVFRGAFIAAGAALIENFSWVLYVFAVFLVVTGIRMFRSRDEHVDPGRSRTLALFRRIVPMTDAYLGQRFLVRRAGVLVATRCWPCWCWSRSPTSSSPSTRSPPSSPSLPSRSSCSRRTRSPSSGCGPCTSCSPT